MNVIGLIWFWQTERGYWSNWDELCKINRRRFFNLQYWVGEGYRVEKYWKRISNLNLAEARNTCCATPVTHLPKGCIQRKSLPNSFNLQIYYFWFQRILMLLPRKAIFNVRMLEHFICLQCAMYQQKQFHPKKVPKSLILSTESW